MVRWSSECSRLLRPRAVSLRDICRKSRLTPVTYAASFAALIVAGCGDDGAMPTDAGTDAAMSADGGTADIALVVDELRAQGSDWIELRNSGSSPLSLRGLRISDGDAEPNAEHITALPAEVTLAPDERFVVICKPTPLLEGLQTGANCPVDGVERCIHADFKLSHGNGDTVFVLDAEGRVGNRLVYPAMGSQEGESWCRLSATSTGERCAPTPGAANEAPGGGA